MKQKAEFYLKKALNNPSATFRDGQWESIEQLLLKKRVLVVQRTGWGKSMVYFLVTKLMREQGSGPTLLISPLLSLMRNQIEAAERIGIKALTINSTNIEEWDQIYSELSNNKVDILLISPERLANDEFRQNVLSKIAEKIGLLAVDEAHCISDWGHDFRPDYRLIVRVLKLIPANIPVLATTATANNRVVNDIKSQLGNNLLIQRGTLIRKSLKLQNIFMPNQANRMAWLVQTIPQIKGSGIVYTLTKRDAERVANWLMNNGIDAYPYHSDIDPEEKIVLEQKLLENKIKTLVATVALGMGFDKPDLGFVIHFQRPASVVHYYQQVGRAGRAVTDAYGILLCGNEDDTIAEYFRQNAFPFQQHVNEIISVLDNSEDGLSTIELQQKLNLGKGRIEKTLKYLSIESPSPIIKIKTKWMVTALAKKYSMNVSYINEINNIRIAEQNQMNTYMQYNGCLMSFLQNALDDPFVEDCGRCKNCNPEKQLINETIDENLANKARLFLRHGYNKISPKKCWPIKNIFHISPLDGYKIPENLQFAEGRALSLYCDEGWGKYVYEGKYCNKHFSDELIGACIEMIENWNPQPVPQWITCIPSLNHPKLVPDFALRLANKLGLPFVNCIKKIKTNRQQKEMQNSYQQVKNLDGVFEIDSTCKNTPCLLIDDMIDSGWTFTVSSALLRKAGCSTVYPLALAMNELKME